MAWLDRSLWAIGIDFTDRSHRSGSDLRWSGRGRLFHLLKLLCSFPGFRPQAEGELEEGPRVDGQLRRHFLDGYVPGRLCEMRGEHRGGGG